MATNPIYLETEEEIPEVIDRIRHSSSDDVPLVLPARSRLGQSRFNFQLLKQYATRLGKTVSIISPDPQVQRMAEESGFLAFRGVDQYGGGTPAVEAGAAAAPVAPGRAEPRRIRLAPPARGLQSRGRPGRTILYLGALLLLAAGLVAMVVFVPSAQVTLVAEARPFPSEREVTIAAEPGKPPVRVRAAQISRSASASFSTTGLKVIPAAAAKGSVVFRNGCNLPLTDGLKLENGARLRGGSVQFALNGGKVVVPNGGTATSTVIATAAGNAGNVGGGTITTIENNPYDCLKVNNPDATTGGQDEQSLKEVAAADYETARSSLEQQLRREVEDELGRQVQAGEKLAGPLIQPPDFAADHKVGDNVAGFSATVTVKAEASFYAAEDVNRAFADSLRQQVPKDQTLLESRVSVTPAVVPGAGGHLVFKGRPTGFVAPRLDLEALRRHMTGRSTSQTRTELGRLPVRSVDIQESPLRLPLMPLVGSRIDLRYVVEQGSAVPRTT